MHHSSNFTCHSQLNFTSESHTNISPLYPFRVHVANLSLQPYTIISKIRPIERSGMHFTDHELSLQNMNPFSRSTPEITSLGRSQTHSPSQGLEQLVVEPSPLPSSPTAERTDKTLDCFTHEGAVSTPPEGKKRIKGR